MGTHDDRNPGRCRQARSRGRFRGDIRRSRYQGGRNPRAGILENARERDGVSAEKLGLSHEVLVTSGEPRQISAGVGSGAQPAEHSLIRGPSRIEDAFSLGNKRTRVSSPVRESG